MVTKKTAAKKAPPKKPGPAKGVTNNPDGKPKGSARAINRDPNAPPIPGEAGYKGAHLFKKGQVANPIGKVKGARNKFSIMQAKEKAKQYDIMPLDYMLSELNNPKAGRIFKLDCAKAAAPYCHRKLPIGVDNGSGGPIGVYSAEQLMKLSDDELAKLTIIMTKLSSMTLGISSETGVQAAITAAVIENELEDDENS